MGKKQEFEKVGQAGIYRPVKPKGPSFGDILGGIVMFAIGFVALASCVG